MNDAAVTVTSPDPESGDAAVTVTSPDPESGGNLMRLN